MPGRCFSDVAAAELSPSERWPSVLPMGGSPGVKQRSVMDHVSVAVRPDHHLEMKKKKVKF